MFKKLLFVVAAVGLLAACEDPRTYRPITGADLKTYNHSGDQFVELAVKLKTERLELPELSMPVTHANRPELKLATLTFRPTAKAGVSELLVSVNVTGAAGLEGASPTLPNGTVIPVGGVDMSQLVALPLDGFNNNGRIYLAVDTVNATAIIGAALTWEALDSFGQAVGPLNFFPSFDIAQGIKGIAGVFGSRMPGQSGVAVFADASQLLGGTHGFANKPAGQVIFLQ